MSERSTDVCIDSPELLTGREQFRDTVVTGAMWALYVYLWVPLISLLAWILGFEFAYDVMIRAGGAVHLGTVLFWYAIAITTIFIIFGVWSLSNLLRFAGHNRRGNFDRIEDQSFMAFFGISAEDLERLRSGRSLTLELDAVGAIGEIADADSVSQPSPARPRRDKKAAKDN